MGKFVDITGQRFGRLTVLSKAKPDANLRTRWLVKCDCGTEKLVDGAHMRYGHIRSCGCFLAEVLVTNAHKHLTRFAGHNRRHGTPGFGDIESLGRKKGGLLLVTLMTYCALSMGRLARR